MEGELTRVYEGRFSTGTDVKCFPRPLLTQRMTQIEKPQEHNCRLIYQSLISLKSTSLLGGGRELTAAKQIRTVETLVSFYSYIGYNTERLEIF